MCFPSLQEDTLRVLLAFSYKSFLSVVIMPRENRISRVGRLTRSGLRDPIWETIVILQKRVKVLERQVRREEKSKLALEEEVQGLRLEVDRFQDRRALFVQNRELELENFNLRNSVSRLEQLLTQLQIPIPAPLNRSFSAFEFA